MIKELIMRIYREVDLAVISRFLTYLNKFISTYISVLKPILTYCRVSLY